MKRAGHTLVELLVVLPLALLLAALVITSVVAQSRLARRLAELVSRAEAERIASNLLPAELRWAAATDLRTDGTDSVRARIFRGVAVPCGGAWSWSGLRAPAPDKDSALIVTAAGESVAAVTAAAEHTPCGGYQLTLSRPPAPGVLLVFETGTYYLRDRALRFRTGAEGRQPLTEEWFRDADTQLLRGAAGLPAGLQLGVRPAADGRTVELRRVSWTLANALP